VNGALIFVFEDICLKQSYSVDLRKNAVVLWFLTIIGTYFTFLCKTLTCLSIYIYFVSILLLNVLITSKLNYSVDSTRDKGFVCLFVCTSLSPVLLNSF